jgi:hypothetical protein
MAFLLKPAYVAEVGVAVKGFDQVARRGIPADRFCHKRPCYGLPVMRMPGHPHMPHQGQDKALDPYDLQDGYKLPLPPGDRAGEALLQVWASLDRYTILNGRDILYD